MICRRIALVSFDSLEALAAAAATDDGRLAGQSLLEDERRFIDLARSPLFLAEEHVIIGEGSDDR